MTHLLDSSAALANLFGEPGTERVQTLLKDPKADVGLSILTLFEVFTTVFHRTDSDERATEAVGVLREVVREIVPVTDGIVRLAIDLRRSASACIALADNLIAATAAHADAILVHRDPPFSA